MFKWEFHSGVSIFKYSADPSIHPSIHVRLHSKRISKWQTKPNQPPTSGQIALSMSHVALNTEQANQISHKRVKVSPRVHSNHPEKIISSSMPKTSQRATSLIISKSPPNDATLKRVIKSPLKVCQINTSHRKALSLPSGSCTKTHLNSTIAPLRQEVLANGCKINGSNRRAHSFPCGSCTQTHPWRHHRATWSGHPASLAHTASRRWPRRACAMSRAPRAWWCG